MTHTYQVIEFLEGKLVEAESRGETAKQDALIYNETENFDKISEELGTTTSAFRTVLDYLKDSISPEAPSKLEELRIKLDELLEDHHECMMGEDAQPEVEAEFQRAIHEIKKQIDLIEVQLLSDESASEQDETATLNSPMHKLIMDYYKEHCKSTRGVIATVIHEADERAKRAQEEADRLTKMRQSMYAYCTDLLRALWDIEKEGILRYEESAFISKVETYEPASESFVISDSYGEAIVIYSSPTIPCRISYDVNQESVIYFDIVLENGESCSKEEAFDFFMIIASEFLNAFIANNNIAR